MSRHARPHVETHSRARGHSAVAGAAYRLGLKLLDRRTGEWHDFRQRALGEDIVRALTIAPDGAPPWASDPAELWNRVEAAERRKDSQVARDYRVPVPLGLTDTQAGDIAEAMARYIVQALGTSVSVGLHRDAGIDAFGRLKSEAGRGYHAHLYFPTRRIVCTEGDGEGDEGGMGEKLAMLANRRTSAEYVERFNEQWARLCNQFAADMGLAADYDHRSYARQGLPIVPQPTLGAPAVALERDGFFTRKGDEAREIIVMSEVYRQAHAAALEAQHAQAMADHARTTPGTSIHTTLEAPVPAASAPVAPDTSEVRPPITVSLDSGSVLSRFRASIGAPDSDEAASKHAEALSLVRVIQTALRLLERLAEALLRFAKDAERERAAALDVESELVRRRAQRATAQRRLKAWEAAHPWRMAAARAKGGEPEHMPEAWRHLQAQVRSHHDDVHALKAARQGHQRALGALDEQCAPLHAQREVQEGRLRGVLKSLTALGGAYAAQLLAVCRETERAFIEASMSDAMTRVEKSAEHKLSHQPRSSSSMKMSVR